MHSDTQIHLVRAVNNSLLLRRSISQAIAPVPSSMTTIAAPISLTHTIPTCRFYHTSAILYPILLYLFLHRKRLQDVREVIVDLAGQSIRHVLVLQIISCTVNSDNVIASSLNAKVIMLSRNMRYMLGELVFHSPLFHSLTHVRPLM